MYGSHFISLGVCWRVHAPGRARLRACMSVCAHAYALAVCVQVRLFVGKENTGDDAGRHGQLGTKV